MGREIDAALHCAWRKRLERFESSSVTVAEFCRRESVSTAAFYQWRKRWTREVALGKKRRSQRPPTRRVPAARPQGRATGFVELAVSNLAVVELELPNGVRIRVPAEREAALGAAIRAAGEVACHLETSGQEDAPC